MNHSVGNWANTRTMRMSRPPVHSRSRHRHSLAANKALNRTLAVAIFQHGERDAPLRAVIPPVTIQHTSTKKRQTNNKLPTLNHSHSQFRSRSPTSQSPASSAHKKTKTLFRYSWSKGSHTCHQAFPGLVQNYGVPRKPSSISFASRPRSPRHGISFRFT